jgi:phenylalanyl-tRNA synthetase beta chain
LVKTIHKIDWNSEETAALLTDLGLEVEVVEKYQSIKGGLEGIVVGHVLTCVPHPDDTKITTVDLGDGVPYKCMWSN